jgi:GNAT superfamily N-acetyltransferase
MTIPIVERTRGEYVVSSDPARIDLDVVHGYLRESYWAAGMPLELLRRAIEGSITFGVYHGDRQAGFARVITDAATYAYLSDVFILEEFRGRGLSTFLMDVIMAHPALQGLRRFALSTRDAHGLYARYGFAPLAQADRHLEIFHPAPYRAAR